MKHGNIEELTLRNKYFRRVISTTKQQQVVLMNIPPHDEIGKEKHSKITQFIRIEGGKGVAILNNTKYSLKDGDFIVVPAGTTHNIKNTSSTKDLLLYTIYSYSENTSPEHSKNEKSM